MSRPQITFDLMTTSNYYSEITDEFAENINGGGDTNTNNDDNNKKCGKDALLPIPCPKKDNNRQTMILPGLVLR